MRLEEEIKQEKFDDERIKATINVLFTASWLNHRISTHLKKYGLYHEQFNALRILRGQFPKAISQREILCRMLDRSSNLTRIIARLKEKKLVQVNKSDTDRREYQISITQKGLDLLAEIDKDFELNSVPVSGLGVSEAFHLNALLDKMRDIDCPGCDDIEC